MQADQTRVGLTPVPTAARLVRQRKVLRSRIISAVVSLALLTLIFYFFNPGWGTTSVIVIYAIWIASTVIWLVLSLVGISRAKRDLRSIDQGDGLRIDADGIEFLHPQPRAAAWEDVDRLRLTGNGFGAGPAIALDVQGREAARIPLSFLDATPSAIDSAVFARSLGRVRLDASDLDKLF